MCEMVEPQRFGLLIGMAHIEPDGPDDPRPLRETWRCCVCRFPIENKYVRGQRCDNCSRFTCFTRPTAEQLEERIRKMQKAFDAIFSPHERQDR